MQDRAPQVEVSLHTFHTAELNQGLASDTRCYCIPDYNRSLRALYKQRGMNTFDVTPTTFVVRSIDNRREAVDGWAAFEKHYRDLSQGKFRGEAVPSKHCRRNMWIVKPAGLNQGRGIEVCSCMAGGVPHALASYVTPPLVPPSPLYASLLLSSPTNPAGVSRPAQDPAVLV